MKKKFFAFVCSAMISINCLTFNTVEAKVLEPEVIKTETWEASYFIDDDYETLYPYLKCIFNVYSNGKINFRVYNTHEFDGFSNIYNDIYFPYISNPFSFSESYYKEIEDTETYSSELVDYTPTRNLYNLILGYSSNGVNYSTESQYISLNDTDIRECIPINKNVYENETTCLTVGDYFKWACVTGSTSTTFPDKFVGEATCAYYNNCLTQFDNDDRFSHIVGNCIDRYSVDTVYVKHLSLNVAYTDSNNNCDNYIYTRSYPIYRINDVSLAELGSYRGYEYDDGLIVEYNVVGNPHKFPTDDMTYTIFGKTITVPSSIYGHVDDTVDKQLTPDQQYIHDLERQLNETRSELEKYQALDYGNDGKITALDAQMLLSYYAESIVGNNSGEVSGYNDFISNTET